MPIWWNRIVCFSVACAAAEWVRARAAVGRHAAQDPDREREEAALVRLGQSFDREIERYCARLDCVPVETPQRLASESPTMLAGKPFGRKGKKASMVKYRSVGHRYLGFCYRAYKLGRDEALVQLAVRFTEEQWGLLGDIMHELGEGDDTWDSGFSSGGSGRSESEDDGNVDDYTDDDTDDTEYEGADYGRADMDEDHKEDDEEEGSGPRFDCADAALDWAVYRFQISSIRQNIGGKVYANPLLCFRRTRHLEGAVGLRAAAALHGAARHDHVVGAACLSGTRFRAAATRLGRARRRYRACVPGRARQVDVDQHAHGREHHCQLDGVRQRPPSADGRAANDPLDRGWKRAVP